MAGIYIHIPFCKQKCTYCDFHFSTSFESYRSEMIDAINKEIVSRKDYLNKERLNSVYFGGGTPSILTGEELSILLNTIRAQFEIADDVEITLEANPDDIQTESLKMWKNVGINRLSIGIQSFREEDLVWMNRAHTVEEGLNCVVLAKEAGFQNLTVDLIYGLPNLSNDEWINHVKKVIDLGVSHVSAYCLTIEERTHLHSLVKSGKIVPANEDQQSEQFNSLVEILKNANFEQYEISNFSLPNCQAVHNTNYWKGTPYLGVGPSAHSFNGTSRSWNISNNNQYIKLINKNEIHFESETLSPYDRFNELLLTGLRASFGVSLAQLSNILELDENFYHQLSCFEKDGLLELQNNTIILTQKGRLQADRIASDLFIVK